MRKEYSLSTPIVVLIAIIATASILSCNQIFRKPISEGIIEYSISYPDTLPPLRYDPSLRPSKMIVKFKNNQTITIIQGMSGSISFSLVQNIKGNHQLILIKLFNKKFYYEDYFEEGELPLMFRQMPRIEITETGETVRYNSFRCSRAVARFADDSLTRFDVLHTSEITIANPNANTTYQSLPGVLLKFRLKLWGQTMQMDAVKVKSANIPDDEFSVPKGYELITKDVLADIIALVQ